VADRRFYLPLAGLSLFVAFYIARLTEGKRLQKVVVPAVICLSLIGLTIWRNFAWQSNLSFWKATQATNSQDPYVSAMAAKSYLEAGKLEEARKETDLALKLKSDNPIALLIAGQLSLKGKDYPHAEEFFNKAMSLAQSAALSPLSLREAQLGLAEAQVNLKKFDKAKELLMPLLVADRNNVRANLIMGKCLIGLKQPKLALQFLNSGSKAQYMNPEYLEPIAEAALATGEASLVGSAYGAARRGLSIAPSENLERIMAQCALEMGQFPESERMIDALLKQQPDNATYLYLKSCVEKQLNNAAAAEQYRKKALSVDPNIAEKVPIKILSEVAKPPH
jgi:predicted Zn-dependent protease